MIESTDAHPFWVVTDEPDLDRAARTVVDKNGALLYHQNLEPGLNGYWVEAKDLRVGDVFLGADGEISTLTNIVRVEQSGGIAVFNFTVEGNHNYFVLAKEYVLGQSCVLVHNAILCKAPQGSRSREQIMDEIKNGFDPANYPGRGLSLGDEIAAETYRFYYQNGIQKFEIPDDVLKRLIDANIIEELPLQEGIEYLVRPDKIQILNKFLQLSGTYQ